MIYLNNELEGLWQGQDPFDVVESLQGKVYREVKNRRTIQFSLNGKSYFLKLHRGVGWSEIVKNLGQLRLPVLGARNEWDALKKLHKLGVDTMEVVGYGIKGHNPAKQQSFIITTDLNKTVSLEDFCKDWQQSKPQVRLKRNLIYKVAGVSKILHQNNICHRDFYICHFLLHTPTLDQDLDPKLSLIDLHRALIKNRLSRRWVEKDLSGLYFSAMDIGLTRNDLYRFIKTYSGDSLRECLNNYVGFWDKVDAKAKKMHKRLM